MGRVALRIKSDPSEVHSSEDGQSRDLVEAQIKLERPNIVFDGSLTIGAPRRGAIDSTSSMYLILCQQYVPMTWAGHNYMPMARATTVC